MGCNYSRYFYLLINILFRVESYDKTRIGLDHFEIQKLIGKGGFGKVNAVKKISEPYKGKWYAMKTISKKMVVLSRDGDATRLGLIAERNILSLICHPFICNLHCI